MKIETMNCVRCIHSLIFAAAAFTLAPTCSAQAQQSSSSSATVPQTKASVAPPLSPVRDALSRNPWNYGVFFNGGVGSGSEPSDDHFLAVGARAGKVLTHPAGPGFLKGQFEYSVELMPWWQGYTSPFLRYNLTSLPASKPDAPPAALVEGPYRTGGAYNGVSVTPIILRWDFIGSSRVLPFIQGAGGLVWTNHKFPPVGPLPEPGHQGTSVWNFTPQFGIGFQYFLRPNRSITFNANAVHISNASLGDANPGVNATVQFQIGYTWWK